MKQKAVFTRGSIEKTMLKTAFSMLAATLALSGYNIVDTYFVGNLGKIPLAAMSFTFPVVMLIGCIFHGLGTGIMTTAAQSIGGGHHQKAAALVTSGALLVFLLSILTAALGILTCAPVFRLLGAQGETLENVLGYMNIWYLGYATASLGMVANNILIASGDSKRASGLMFAGLVINAILDPAFISGFRFIPAMGIRGAALATVIAQGVTAFVGLWFIYHTHRLLEFRAIPFRELRKTWGCIIYYGVPSAIGMLMMPIGSSIVTWITSRFGDSAVAAAGAAGRLEMIAFVFPMSLGISLMPMIGQNFGARLYSRIRICHKFSTGFAGGFLLVMAVIYFFSAEYLVSFFTKDEEVRRIMVQCLQITAWGFGMIEIHRFSGFFYTGCGRPAISAWLNGYRIALMIPFSFIALYFRSLPGLFAARLAADVISGMTGWILSRRMVFRLPEDGTPVEKPQNDAFGIFKNLPFFRRKPGEQR